MTGSLTILLEISFLLTQKTILGKSEKLTRKNLSRCKILVEKIVSVGPSEELYANAENKNIGKKVVKIEITCKHKWKSKGYSQVQNGADKK